MCAQRKVKREVVGDALRDLELIRKAGIEGLEPVFDLLNGALMRQYLWLSNNIVSDVHWVSSTTLTATIPVTMPPGIHDLWVVNPGGQAGVWSGKLMVGKQVYLPIVQRE